MKNSRFAMVLCLLFAINTVLARAQKGESYHDLLTPQVKSDKLPMPEQLRSYIVDGKLRLSLRDAVKLTLENNSSVRIQETSVEFSKFGVLGAHGPFDPLVTASYNVNSSTSPPSNSLQGTGTSAFSSTVQTGQFTYSQTFESGTNFQASISSNSYFSNNSFYFLNPVISSYLSFQITQPLLKNGWFFANRAPIIIARKNLEQSKASFAAGVSNSILLAANAYWNVVQAQGTLSVARRSQDAAEASYKHDKRALELGALAPLDIYRSESEFASRRVAVIQDEYALKEAEDALRMTIGADQDPYFAALDLVLTEVPEPTGDLLTVDAATLLQEALTKRPEIEAAHDALVIDSARIRLAHNQLLPELDLTGSYASNGVGGTQFSATGQKMTMSSINQAFGFGYPTYEATLALTLPIRNRAAKAQLGTALVSRRSDLYNERQWQEQVKLDVANAVHQLEQAKLGIAAGKEALDAARKNTAAEQRKYELGTGLIFLVLDAQNQEALAEQALLQAEIGYQQAVAGVDHATGQLLEPYNVQIAELMR